MLHLAGKVAEAQVDALVALGLTNFKTSAGVCAMAELLYLVGIGMFLTITDFSPVERLLTLCFHLGRVTRDVRRETQFADLAL